MRKSAAARGNPARPLSDDELVQVDALLEAINPEAAMVLEELDGFVTALACSPLPLSDERMLALACGDDDEGGGGEQHPGGQGGNGGEPAAGPGQASRAGGSRVAQRPALEMSRARAELAVLLRRHRLSIVAALHSGEGLEPVMERDEAGASRGNLWAIGFLRGIDAQAAEWTGLDDNADLAAWLEPFERLAEELDLESGEVLAPIDGARQEVVDDMIDSAFAFYHHYEPSRSRATAPRPVRHEQARPGRNAPCPCGSGRKYKRCCGADGAGGG